MIWFKAFSHASPPGCYRLTTRLLNAAVAFMMSAQSGWASWSGHIQISYHGIKNKQCSYQHRHSLFQNICKGHMVVSSSTSTCLSSSCSSVGYLSSLMKGLLRLVVRVRIPGALAPWLSMNLSSSSLLKYTNNLHIILYTIYDYNIILVLYIIGPW